MTDLLQTVVVTAAAGAAMLTIVRPYVGRKTAGDGRPCPNCSSAKPCGPAPSVHRLTVIRTSPRTIR